MLNPVFSTNIPTASLIASTLIPWHPFILRIVIISFSLLVSPLITANQTDMSSTYEAIKSQLEKNVYGIPIFINSNTENQTMLGEVYGTLPYSFPEIKQALTRPANWCDIVPQHLNIKACTYQHKDDYCEITFYTGRKFYEKPEDVFQIQYQYKLVKNSPDHFYISFTAAKGPMGTKDYVIEVEAIPLMDKVTFIRFSYAYKYNWLTELGMNTYLATLGSDKVGFSTTGTDENGKTVYIDGTRGIIERNSVRYYLAIKSYLESQNISIDRRFNARINKWFDLTENYHRQLYELDKKDYLEYKQMERKDQLSLQSKIDKNTKSGQRCNEN
jgi:hypothetical protein